MGNKGQIPRERIEKIHRETCVKELKQASRLIGNETERELVKIYGRCVDIQGAILLNGFISR